MLIGGPGDTLTGGNGEDTFVFAPNFGLNRITNFNTDKDTIQLDHSEFANFNAVLAAAHQNGADTVIAHAADQITLTGVNITSLHASDFQFSQMVQAMASFSPADPGSSPMNQTRDGGANRSVGATPLRRLEVIGPYGRA